LVVYDETTDTWARMSNFQATNIPSVQKRQQPCTGPNPTVLEGEDIPVGTFAAIAMSINANCWIQAHTFDLAWAPFSGTFIGLEQMSIISGNEFIFRFGTNTGAYQTTVDGLAPYAICLPLARDLFTTVFLEARESFMPAASPSLIPEDFPSDTFTAMENAPIIVGHTFSIESVIL